MFMILVATIDQRLRDVTVQASNQKDFRPIRKHLAIKKSVRCKVNPFNLTSGIVSHSFVTRGMLDTLLSSPYHNIMDFVFLQPLGIIFSWSSAFLQLVPQRDVVYPNLV